MFFGGVPPFSHHTISVAGRQSAIGQGRALPAPQQSPRLYSIGGLYYISFRESGGCKNRRWLCLGSPGISPSCAGHKPAFAAALPSPIFPRRRSFLPPQLQRVLRADGLAHAAAGAACRIQYYFPASIVIAPYRQLLTHLPQPLQPPVRWAVRGRGGSSSKACREPSASPHTSSME